MKRCKRAPLAALVLVLACLGAARGPAQAAPGGLQPSAAAARLAGLAEPLAVEDFQEAALAFSGAEGAALGQARAGLGDLLAQAAALAGEPPREAAEELLALLHRRTLRRYDERQTRLDELLATGRYNCVSSAVLYGLLARALGLEFRAVQTTDHAFIRVLAGAEGWDVETTNPYGFDPGRRREFTDSFGRVTGYSYVPPGQYGRRRESGDKDLLALILYNRNAELTEAGRYLEALQPAVDAHALRRDGESRERLLLSCLNAAAWYGQAGRHAEGLAFLAAAGRDLEDPRLERVGEDLLHNWAVSLMQAGRLQEAQELIDGRRAAGRLSEREWRALGVSIWQLRAREASRRDYGEAAALLRAAMQSLGPEAELAAGYEVYVHNQAAGLVNSGRLREAGAVLREALQVLPASRLLREDEARLARRPP